MGRLSKLFVIQGHIYPKKFMEILEKLCVIEIGAHKTIVHPFMSHLFSMLECTAACWYSKTFSQVCNQFMERVQLYQTWLWVSILMKSDACLATAWLATYWQRTKIPITDMESCQASIPTYLHSKDCPLQRLCIIEGTTLHKVRLGDYYVDPP